MVASTYSIGWYAGSINIWLLLGQASDAKAPRPVAFNYAKLSFPRALREFCQINSCFTVLSVNGHSLCGTNTKAIVMCCFPEDGMTLSHKIPLECRSRHQQPPRLPRRLNSHPRRLPSGGGSASDEAPFAPGDRPAVRCCAGSMQHHGTSTVRPVNELRNILAPSWRGI
eukprot:scaffold122426_cov20-Prasinocladus_malaysianus.AAC.1